MEHYKNIPIILVGDFNCHLDGHYNDWPELREINKMQLNDTWKILRRDEPGFTEDSDINDMRWNQKQMRKIFRYDAIKYKNGFVPHSIEMIGTTGFNLTVDETAKYLKNYNIDLNKDNIRYANPEKTLISMWPSDHFGLFSKFIVLDAIK